MSTRARILAPVIAACAGGLLACGEWPARGPVADFTDAATPLLATSVGTAPMVALAPSGTRALAWVSAPDSGTDARLYVSVDGRPPSEIRDSLGPVEAHGESPPKLAFGPDGALEVIYVVPRVVPGRRFPLAALRFIRSTDGGSSWSRPVNVTDDAEFGTHNFHALLAAPDGSIYVSWLDSRTGTSGAWLTRSADGGRTWEPSRRVGSGEACPCCRTALAVAPSGALYIAWRMVLPGNIRDVVVARSDDHGHTWREPVRVHADNWVYPGCPHAGPSLQVDSTGRVHVAWWTGKTGAAGVAYARSDDGGRSFDAPVPLGIAAYSRPAHVQLGLGAGGIVAAAWDDGTMETPRIVMRLSRDGGASFGPVQDVSAAGVQAGFPAVAVRDSMLTLVWSEDRGAAVPQPAEHRMSDSAMLHPVGNAQVMLREATFGSR